MSDAGFIFVCLGKRVVGAREDCSRNKHITNPKTKKINNQRELNAPKAPAFSMTQKKQRSFWTFTRYAQQVSAVFLATLRFILMTIEAYKNFFFACSANKTKKKTYIQILFFLFNLHNTCIIWWNVIFNIYTATTLLRVATVFLHCLKCLAKVAICPNCLPCRRCSSHMFDG